MSNEASRVLVLLSPRNKRDDCWEGGRGPGPNGGMGRRRSLGFAWLDNEFHLGVTS